MFLLLVCIMGMFLVSSVSASDLNETSLSQSERQLISVEEIDDAQEELGSGETSESEGLSVTDLENLSTEYTPTSSSEIQTYINNANNGDTIILDGYYLLNSTITVNKQLDFVGKNNATVDGNNAVQLFSVSTSGVTFKNITFKNGKSSYGAVCIDRYSDSINCTFINCTFINNSANSYGGAICFEGRSSRGFIVNCSFVGNSAKDNGGAVYFRDSNGVANGTILNCSFVGNSARYGGAVSGGYVVNCSFVNNSASGYGGALSDKSTSINCIFINNSAGYSGGAVSGVNSLNCIFINNSAIHSGGAIRLDNLFTISNCTFIGNYAEEGGAIDVDGKSIELINCSFINCNATSGGAIYNRAFLSLTLQTCYFENCTSKNGGYLQGRQTWNILDCIFDEPPVGIEYHYSMTLNVSNVGRFLIASLSNILGPAVGKVISFNINGTQINETTDSDGLISIDLSEAGNYSVVASYAGDGINNPVSVNTTLVVIPISLTVNDLDIYVGDVGYLIANLYDDQGNLSNENVSFIVEGNEYNITTDLNGLATFKVTDYLTETGSYTVDVMFAKDGYVASAISNVVIKKYDSSLIAENLNVYIGNEGVLLANLSDSRGPLSNKTITFKIGNDEYNATTDENGIVTLKVTDYLTVYGSYQVMVSFAGDEFDKPSSTVVSVNINRYDSVLAVNDLNIFKDENISLVANLSDLRGALSNKIIVFTVDDVDYDVATDANGLAPFEVTKYLGEGRYTVTVKFAGDEFDKPFETIVNVTINKYDSILSANNLVIFKDESDCLVANLSDIRGPLSNKKIIFTVNNVKFENFTDLNGLASFDINSYLDEGTYPVSVSFAGDDFDKPASTNVNVTLKKYDSILTVNDLSIVLGDAGILTVNLSNMRGPISGQTIRFILPNQQEYTRTTNSQGLANLPITNYLSELGKHTVTVKFEGNDANDPVSINASVIISLYKGNLTVTQNGKYYGDTELTFRLVNSKTDMPIPYAPIKVIFSDGRPVQLSTDSNGLVNYPVPFEPGEYTYTASVTSDNVDVNTLSIDDLVINKMVGEIQLSHEDYSKTLMVKLVNPENGDVYRNVNVNLEFSNGEYVEVTTNDLGIAIYDMPFTPDTYWVIASVTGDYKEFEIAELDDMVISDKDNSKIVIYDDVIFDYNKSGRTTFSVTNGRVLEENIVVINHPEAIISLNNNEIVVSNLSAGSYTLRVVTTPNEGYNSVVGTKPIIVNRIYSSVSFDNSIAFDYLGSGSTTVNVVGGSVGNVTIDGNPQGAVINLTGNTITVSGINAGTYTLRVTSIPDENHKSIDGTTYITVRKIDSQVSVSDVAFNYDQSGFANVIVTGGSVSYDKIEVIGQPLASISFANNMITISNLNVGTYTLSVTSTPDVNHYASTGTAVITVNKIDSKVTLINPIEFDYGGSDFTSVYSEGCSISKDNISVLDESGNKVDAKITYENNVISVSNLAAGVYKLIVISTPDVNHKSVMASRNITVNKVESEIKSYTSIVFNYLDTGSTYITIDGGCLSTEKMEVIDHKEARISFANNQIMVSNLNPGIYLLRVESIPDGNHDADVKFITVTVNKAPLKIQPSSVKTFQLNKGVWKVKVVDSQNKPVSNIKVTLKVYTGSKFKTVSIVTNANGEASFNVKGLSKGTHKIVSSISHNGYSANPATSSIKIIKPKVLKFKVKKRENKKMGSLITFQILDKKTKRGVNGVKVKLMIYTGKKYKAFILKSKKVGKFKGIVGVFTNEFSVGKHKVVVKPISLKYSGSGKSTITIKKSAKKYSKKTTKA